MGQPGFDEMGGDAHWDLWRGLLALRSNYGICKQEEGDAAPIFSGFLNVDMIMQRSVKTENL